MKEKKFTFDLSVDAWIKDITIEAESYDDALEELHLMSLEKLIEVGYVKDFSLANIDVEVEEDDDYDEEDDDYQQGFDEDDAFSEDREKFVNDADVLAEYAKEITKLTGRHYDLSKTPSGQIGIGTQFIISDADEDIIRNLFSSKNIDIKIFNRDGIIRVLK